MTFSEKLQRAMKEMGLSQSQVSEFTGRSKASISQYVSGQQVPPRNVQSEIAKSLSLEPDYFTQEQPFEFPECEQGIPTLTLHDVAKLMHKHTETIALGLQQGVFPWGYAIKTSENRWSYFINAKSFALTEKLI